MTPGEITEKAKDGTTPAIELMIGSIVEKAVTQGDDRRLEFILQRLIGKAEPKDVTEDALPEDLRDYRGLTDEDIASRARRVQARLRRLINPNDP